MLRATSAEDEEVGASGGEAGGATAREHGEVGTPRPRGSHWVKKETSKGSPVPGSLESPLHAELSASGISST